MNKKEMKAGILGYIPGFRTGTKWKMVIAAVYYLFSLLCLFGGLWFFLFMVSMPFFIMNIATALRRKNKLYLIPSVIAFVVLIISVTVASSSNSVEDTVPTATPLMTATPTAIPTETAAPTANPTPVPTPEPTLVPTAAPTPEPTALHTVTDTTNGMSEQTVWIGDTGTKYHDQNCRTLRGNKTKITLKEALAQGREPCKVCH